MLPLSAEMMRAIVMDDAHERGELIPEVEYYEEHAATDALAEMILEKKEAKNV